MTTSSLPTSPPRLSITELPKSWTFTSKLPADPKFSTPQTSHETPRHHITPRPVHGALFSYVRPEPAESPELLAVSPAALRTLHIDPGSVSSPDFLNTVSGNLLHGWTDASPTAPDGPTSTQYPWAQCYGGFQFGSWAGQLGDGRAISLFETTSPATGERHELQLKGAGLTPYSRFADGKAVLRSSIREFLASEALHALGISTTRALTLTRLPHATAAREMVEPCAIVLRFAPSWVRLGTFDLPRVRRDYATLRRLAEYVAEEVYGGWGALPGRLSEAAEPSAEPLEEPHVGVPADAAEGDEPLTQENRFTRLYRAIVRRNAAGCASWMVYGFMNGVLNTDNTSVLGLSMDYGPFAFMDTFDPLYTPNHDDVTLRYSYRNQPTIIWWNLVRLGEDLAHLLGAGAEVDGQLDVRSHDDMIVHQEALVPRAEALIGQAGKEYKAVFTAEYRRLMLRRLGLRDSYADADIASFLPDLLDALAACRLDFHRFFRTLSCTPRAALGGEGAANDNAVPVAPETASRVFGVAADVSPDARAQLAKWLTQWRSRAAVEWPTEVDDAERQTAMKKVNPKFVLRSWVLAEIIERVQKNNDTDVLRRALHMALNPFADEWTGRTFDGELYHGDEAEEKRWTDSVPETKASMQCSCSS
ncbi:hypothetical protein BROUX41_000328 [Berkeleyomyces rouxiae]|uniref:uncharacterized protein n=1 Tax=Berkeleyomyces rouxiae TaxID=2035830 RepID=UPI003B800FA9